MRSLQKCLLDTEWLRLETISQFWDVDLKSTRPREAASELAEAMAKPDAVTQAWDDLPDEQKEALEALLAAEGQMPRLSFSRNWGETRAMGPGRMERVKPWREPISPAEGLWYRGFIFHAFEEGPEGIYEVAFIPPEIKANLPDLAPAPPTISLEPTEPPPATKSHGDAFLEDACTLLAYLQNERVKPNHNADWPKRHHEHLLQRMHTPDEERLMLLKHLAHQVGWLRLSDSRRLRPDPEPVTSWLQSPTRKQRALLIKAWRDDPTWNDLFHIPTLRPEDTGSWHNDPLLARKAILRHLEATYRTPSERDNALPWHTIEDFVAAIKEIDPDFQRPDGDYTKWYIREASGEAYLSGFENWEAIEGKLIHYLLTKPLAWLGIIELSAGSPARFRLTRAGAAFLDLADAASSSGPSPPASLTLRPDFTVLVPPGRRYERFQLARVADWLRTGDPFVYRITPGSLSSARQQGISIKRILEFLEETTEEPIPGPIEKALTRWDIHGSEIRLEQSILLRVTSEELMSEIMASPHIQRLVQEKIGPTRALIHERDWPRLVKALSAMGLLSETVGLEDSVQ